MKRFTIGLLVCITSLMGEGLSILLYGGATSSAQSWRTQRPLDARITPRFRTLLSQTPLDETIKIWIFFTDKGIADEQTYQRERQNQIQALTDRNRLRRVQRGKDEIVDFYDLPVFPPYIDQVVSKGAQLHVQSRWLNAISVTTTPSVVQQLEALPFVRSLQPVTVHRRPLTPAQPDNFPSKPLTPSSNQALDYGSSETQLAQIKVPELHELGLSGRGVLIAMLDTGYDLEHVAFDSLRTRIIAERDFINGDDNTANEPAQDASSQHNHGTETLSTIGAYAPGELIGPAYGADFLLAKTETVSFEQQIEEDWWVQAAEWADSLGADIISSSLGYNVWYQFSDMDGQTAITTQAATIATSRGIIVVNAMGNEGQAPWQKMIAPADADGIISVGAVDSGGGLASFSSRGPTFDGRIKPDVSAMGVLVRVVNPGNPTGYLRLNGTSFATPLTAGVVALLLEAQPHWTPAQILNALRLTASQATMPDTLLGYGIVNALAALQQEANSQVEAFTADNDSSGVLLEWRTTFEVNIQSWKISRMPDTGGAPLLLTVSALPGGGAGVSIGNRTYFFLDILAVPGESYIYTLEATDTDGNPAPIQSQTVSITFMPTNSSNIPSFSLNQNVPNPFNPSTRIVFELRNTTHVTLNIYNILGQRVRILADELLSAGQHEVMWDGTDEEGRGLASGLYFYRLTADTFTSAKKMLLIR